MIVKQIFLGIGILILGFLLGMLLNMEIIFKVLGFGGIFVIIGGFFMSENIFLIDTQKFQNARLAKSRNPESKTQYIWNPLFSSGITFSYPSYMKERRYWGSLKQVLAPFVGIGTLWDKYWVLSNIYDPEHWSFYLSVELNKESFPREPNYSGRTNFRSESFQNDNINGIIQRFTDEINGDTVHVDVLSFMKGGMYTIKCYSLTDDYLFNKPIIDAIYNSVA